MPSKKIKSVDLYDALWKKYSPRIKAFMEKVEAVFDEERKNTAEGDEFRGYVTWGVNEVRGDTYGWWLSVGNSEEELESNDGVDIIFELRDAYDYESDVEAQGIKGAWSLDIIGMGGAILGGLTPYNYTDDVWVDFSDEEAVVERLDLILDNASVEDIYVIVSDFLKE